MSAKRVIGFMALAYAASNVLPLAAQQGPNPSQPAPVPAQPSPNPLGIGTQRAPIIPSESGQVNPQTVPSPGSGVPPSNPFLQGAPAPQSGPVAAPPERRFLPSPAVSSAGMVSLNFNRADLIEIIHIIAQHLRLTYTIDPDVKGTVTINSAEPLKSEDLLPIFHQVLRMNGAVAVRSGNLYRIMLIKDGKGLARPVGQSREDSFALQIVPVRFFSVAEMKKLLTPFLQPGGEIVEYPRGNFLIVIDLPSNIQRLVEIADLVDAQVFAGTRMEIYQPKVASAEELATEMTKILQSYASSQPQTDNLIAEFIPLPRINQLLVISHSEAAWTYAKRWLDRIDVVAEGPGRRIFIYSVENGKADDLAQVLSQALGLPGTGSRASSPTLQDLHRGTTGGMNQPSGGSNPSFGSSGSSGSSGFSNQPRQPGSAFATVPAPGQPINPAAPTPAPGLPQLPGAVRPTTPAVPGTKPEEQLRIVADPGTNSLIIFGTAQEFQNIKNILKELDAIPRQVLIEAMILQVDLKNTEDFGVDYEIFKKSAQTIFGQRFGSAAALTTLGKLFPTAPSFGGVSGLSAIAGDNTLSAMIRALATDSRVKLLSAPSVLATDNRPARIQVGSEEPIPTGTINAAVGQPSISSSTTIQYRNTGRILTIIPQVNSQGLVNLQIKAEVSARGDDVTVGTDKFPAFNTQDAETTAVVNDGETLVIGGLIGERKSKGRSGIPYLMDIPVIGRFFGTTNDATDRTELIMLITPHVIRNRHESRFVTEEFKEKLSTVRNELERSRRDQERLRPKPLDRPAPMDPDNPSTMPGATSNPAPGALPTMPMAPATNSAAPMQTMPQRSPGTPLIKPAPAASLRSPVVQAEQPAGVATAANISPAVDKVTPARSEDKVQAGAMTSKDLASRNSARPIPVLPDRPQAQPIVPVKAPPVMSEPMIARESVATAETAPAVRPGEVKQTSVPVEERVAAIAQPEELARTSLAAAAQAETERLQQLSETVSSFTVAATEPVAPEEQIAILERQLKPPFVKEKVISAPAQEPAREITAVKKVAGADSVKKPVRTWMVQVASFPQEKDADDLAKKLRAKGYDASILAAEVDKKPRYRVQVGQLSSRSEATELQKTLETNEKFVSTLIATR